MSRAERQVDRLTDSLRRARDQARGLRRELADSGTAGGAGAAGGGAEVGALRDSLRRIESAVTGSPQLALRKMRL